MKGRIGASTLAAVLAVAGLGVAGVAGYRLSTGRCMITGACAGTATAVSEKTDSCCPLGGEAAATQTVALDASECTGEKNQCEGMTECAGEMKSCPVSGEPACHGTEAGTTVLAGESAEKDGCGGCPGRSEECDPSACPPGSCEGKEKGEVASGGEKPKESSGG